MAGAYDWHAGEEHKKTTMGIAVVNEGLRHVAAIATKDE